MHIPENIVAYTAETIAFVGEWFNQNDYVEAHTSGSTGAPKKIRLKKADMTLSAESTCRFFNITDRSVLVCPLSVDYIAGKMMVVRALVSGATLHVVEPSNFPLGDCNAKRVDMIAIVPSQLPGLITDVADRNIEIRNVIIGGAPMSQQQERVAMNAPFDAYATYGMTETCSHVALRKIENGNRIYAALPGVKFGVDADCCLEIAAPRFSFGKLQTNDVVKLRSDKEFEWIGRRDNVVLSGGLKAFPEEIENKVRGIINQPFYAIGVNDEKWGSRIVFYIEGMAETEEKSLMEELHNVLKPHEMPREMRYVEQFEYTDNGKLRRIEL